MMPQIANLCRLCANSCYLDADNIFLKGNIELINLVFKYLSIQISLDDFLPNTVCQNCRSTVVSFDEYAQKCCLIQTQLTDMVNKHSIPKMNHDILSNKVKPEEVDDLHNASVKIEFDENCIKSEDENHFEDILLHTSDSYLKKSNKKKSKIIKKTKRIVTQTFPKCIDDIVSKFKDNSFNQVCDIKDELSLGLKGSPPKKSSSFAINSTLLNFSCHLCLEKYTSWATLNNHTKTVHLTNPKIVCICEKFLRTKKSVYYHIIKHKQANLFTCEPCQKSFVTEKYYKRHIAIHESGEFNVLKCGECNKTFLKVSSLKSHEKRHLPREDRILYPCDICGSSFISKSAASAHILHIHKTDRPHMCDVCGATFASKGGLKLHFFKHRTEKAHCCTLCPKRYKTKGQLKKHQHFHSGILFKCDLCQSEFRSKTTLVEHMYVHNDLYRYVCNVCNKEFKWKSSYKMHLNNHTGATPFACPWCPKTFAHSSNCRIHKRRSHPVELAEFEEQQGSAKIQKEYRNIRRTKILKSSKHVSNILMKSNPN